MTPNRSKPKDLISRGFRARLSQAKRTEEEYRVLLEQAGFQLSSVTPTTSVVSIVEGKPV